MLKDLFSYDFIAIIKLSDKDERAYLKPTKITIREFWSVIGVEYLILIEDPKDNVETPTWTKDRFYRLPTTSLSDFFCWKYDFI